MKLSQHAIAPAPNAGVSSPRLPRSFEHGDVLSTILLAWTWMSRYIHIALDTIVLYGVLRERSIDERGDDERSGSDGVSSEQHGMSRGSTRRASGGSHHTGKPAPSLPLV